MARDTLYFILFFCPSIIFVSIWCHVLTTKQTTVTKTEMLSLEKKKKKETKYKRRH